MENKSYKETDLNKRLYNFALKIVLLVRSLPRELAAYEIGKQLLKAGTSTAAIENCIKMSVNMSFRLVRNLSGYQRRIPDGAGMTKYLGIGH